MDYRNWRHNVKPGPILSWRLIMKLFLWSFSSLPLNHSRRVVVSYKRKYVHEALVNCLFKLAQVKVWLGELTLPPWPQLLTWDVKQQNKSSNFPWSILNITGFNGPKWQEMHNIHLFYNKTIVDLCFGRHGVLLNSALNHIDLCSASVNMTFTVQ